MQQKNAYQNMQEVYDKLVDCMDTLNGALGSVEGQENRQRIKNTLGAIDNAIEVTNNALANYTE